MQKKKITNIFLEIKYRLYHIFIINNINFLLIFIYSKEYIYILLNLITKINIKKKEIITTGITEILWCKIKITLIILLISILFTIFLEIFLFIINAKFKNEFILIKKNILFIIVITIILIKTIIINMTILINNVLIKHIPLYINKDFNFNILIKINEFINWNIFLFSIFILITIVLFIIKYYKIILIKILNRKYIYFLILSIISTITPPDYKTTIIITIPLILIIEILHYNIIFNKKWERLDLNQRSIIQ